MYSWGSSVNTVTRLGPGLWANEGLICSFLSYSYCVLFSCLFVCLFVRQISVFTTAFLLALRPMKPSVQREMRLLPRCKVVGA